jgi:hypothetical protein
MKTCPRCHKEYSEDVESCPEDGLPLGSEGRNEGEVLSCVELIDDESHASCPVCQSELSVKGWKEIKCPRCKTQLRPAILRTLKWVRMFVVFGGAALIAWWRGWEPSFIVFTIGFYMIPVIFLWSIIEHMVCSMFPPKVFEVAQSHILRLGI